MDAYWKNNLRYLLVACISVIILGFSDDAKTMKHPSASHFQDCHADLDYHREVLNTYLTNSKFSTDRNTHGTNGITISQIQLVEDTDSECAMLDSVYATSLAKTYVGTSDKFYRYTYYKASGFLFVSRSIKPSPEPHRYASGISTFDVFSSTGTYIKGYAF